jgi:divalent metal cation (Fe/Co/Zn/Cd) transporter
MLPILATFLTITPDNITTMLGYVSDLIGNLTPLLLPIIAVGVGIFIFWAIVKAIR